MRCLRPRVSGRPEMDEWRLNLDREDFLANYWQRKPLLIRDAIPGFKPPLQAEELAGLAMEDEIESRIMAPCSALLREIRGYALAGHLSPNVGPPTQT